MRDIDRQTLNIYVQERKEIWLAYFCSATFHVIYRSYIYVDYVCRKGKKKNWLIASTKKREENDRCSYRSHVHICEGKKRNLIGRHLASNEKTKRKEQCHSTSACQCRVRIRIVISIAILDSGVFLRILDV